MVGHGDTLGRARVQQHEGQLREEGYVGLGPDDLVTLACAQPPHGVVLVRHRLGWTKLILLDFPLFFGATFFTLTGFHGAHVFGGVLMLFLIVAVLYFGIGNTYSSAPFTTYPLK